MDEVIGKLFNNGDNDGTVTLECIDGGFRAHSFVLEAMSPFMKAALELPGNGGLISQCIKLDFCCDVAKAVVAGMYGKITADYVKSLIGHRSVWKYCIEYITAIDAYVVVTSSNRIVLDVAKQHLTANNWLTCLELIPPELVFDELRNVVFEFIKQSLLTYDVLKTGNPLPTDGPWTGRFMELYRERMLEMYFTPTKTFTSTGGGVVGAIPYTTGYIRY